MSVKVPKRDRETGPAPLIYETTRAYLLNILAQGKDLETFLGHCKVQSLSKDEIIKKIESGLTGDIDLNLRAYDYLDRSCQIEARKVELELLQNIGIAPIFLMALLLALGPNNQSSDFMNQESCNERGLLQIRAPKNCPPKKAFNSGLIQRNGVWNLEIEIPISDNLTWTSTYQKIDEDKAISIYLWKNHLPAIIESAFCEKPLKRIISHTIIDVYDLIVRKIETQGDNMIFTVTDSSPKLSLSEASIFLPVKYL